MRRFLPGLFALSIICGLELGCYEDSLFQPQQARGATRVFLTDAPFPRATVSTVEVYVVEISASTDPDPTADVDSWTPLATPMQRFDLMQLQHSRLALLGELMLAADVYHAVRITVDTDSSDVLFHDGTEARVNWSDEGHLEIQTRVPAPIAVPDSGSSIVIDFDLGQSFESGMGDPLHDFLFTPLVRALDGAKTGSLSGTILGDSDRDGYAEPVRNALVTAQYLTSAPVVGGQSQTITAHTDSTGYYKVGFLHPATYTIQIDTPAEAFGTLKAYDVEIGVGEDFVFSVTLPAGPVAGVSSWR